MEQISVLKADEVFVFGSNLGGMHGDGAARLPIDVCRGVGGSEKK